MTNILKKIVSVDSKNEVKISPEKVQNKFESLTRFFSIAYGIILTLSVSYNVGYLNQVNLTIIDMMTIGDFINDSVHHVWFFFIAGILFFISSLASVKKKVGNDYIWIMIFGFAILIVCSLAFVKSFDDYQHLNQIIKQIILNPMLNKAVVLTVITLVVFSIYMMYILFFTLNNHAIPSLILSTTPVVLFIILVALPYLAGSIQADIEKEYFRYKNYRGRIVDITTVTKTHIVDVAIIKTFDKGIVIRSFDNEASDNNKAKFGFISTGAVLQVLYK